MAATQLLGDLEHSAELLSPGGDGRSLPLKT